MIEELKIKGLMSTGYLPELQKKINEIIREINKLQ